MKAIILMAYCAPFVFVNNSNDDSLDPEKMS